MTKRARLEGAQKAQQRMIEIAREQTASGGAMQRALAVAALESHRHAVVVTHKVSGSLALAHIINIENTRATISISPTVTNPRGARPAKYGPIEHRRGGDHSFYDRVIRDGWPGIGKRAIDSVALAMGL